MMKQAPPVEEAQPEAESGVTGSSTRPSVPPASARGVPLGVRVIARLPRWMRWILFRWWLVVAAVATAYVTNATPTLIHKGWDPFWKEITSWGLFNSLVAQYPAPTYIGLALLVLLAPVGYLAKRYHDAYPQDTLTARAHYLAAVLHRYNTVSLPTQPVHEFALNQVFQPLRLRRDPSLDTAESAAIGQATDDASDRLPAEREQADVIAESGEDALEKSPARRIVVLGGPGSGKTTMLKRLVTQAALHAQSDEQAPLPVFISLPHFAQSHISLRQYLDTVVTDLELDAGYANVIWQVMQDSQALICLDGLDNVPAEAREDVTKLIADFSSRWGSAWVVGSRLTDYARTDLSQGNFAEWELRPLDHPMREQLARKLLRGEAGSPAIFVGLIEHHRQAALWGDNPLLFSLAALIFGRIGRLPPNRAALYSEVSDEVLKVREADMARRLVLREILGEIALRLQSSPGMFSMDALLAFLGEIQREHHDGFNRADLARSVINSGLIEAVARDRYRFIHQTFQEFLAAEALARRLTVRRCGCPYSYLGGIARTSVCAAMAGRSSAIYRNSGNRD